MSGDQVLRVLLLKQMNGFSYRDLEFHLADSVTYRTFCRFGALEPTPTRATLAENLKKVRAETLEAIGAMVILYAARTGVERGRKVRVDSTGRLLIHFESCTEEERGVSTAVQCGLFQMDQGGLNLFLGKVDTAPKIMCLGRGRASQESPD